MFIDMIFNRRYKVVLISGGPKKVNVIKSIRYFSGLGLKEAKAIADKTGSTILGDLTKSKAKYITAEMEKITGCKVEIQLDK